MKILIEKIKKMVKSEVSGVRASMFDLPIRDGSIDTISSIHVITSTTEEQRIKSCEEIQRIALKKLEVYLTWPNLNSKHYDKEKIKKSQFSFFHYTEMAKFFQSNFDVEKKRYGSYTRKITYPLKIIYKIPEKFLGDGRSPIMTCKRK